jgi:hypothetical protein
MAEGRAVMIEYKKREIEDDAEHNGKAIRRA